jgi:hypothetical protein
MSLLEKRILWFSRHEPLPSQRAELDRLFPGNTLVVVPDGFRNANDILRTYERLRGDDLVLIAPLTVVKHLVGHGVKPIWSDMRVVPADDPTAELYFNGRAYKFAGFRRVTSVDVKYEEVLT